MLNELQTALEKALQHLQQQLVKLQIGRANAGLVDHLEIEVASYGSKMALQGLANITCPDPQTIRVEPWDKATLGDIERGIAAADIGINPQNMGEHILLPVPPMTEERRKGLVKIVHEETEHARISVRNVRHDFLKKIKHQKDEKEMSEDEANRLEKQIQEKVDEMNKNIDEMAKKKEADILPG